MEFRSQPLPKFAHYRTSRSLVIGGAVLAFAVIAVTMGWLTTVRHSYYSGRAEDNLEQQRRLSYPRGNIVDSHGAVLATNRKVYRLQFTPYGQKDSDARATLTQMAEILDKPTPTEIETILATRPRWTRHEILENANQADVLPFLESPQLFPGVRLSTVYRREYTYPIDFAHVIGYLSRIQPAEVDQYERPRYLLDDMVGRAGLEREYQEVLAGHPGKEKTVHNARGQSLDEPELLSPSEPGADLRLTLDQRLQKRANSLLSGVDGSIVLMDVRDGGIVVLASSPNFDSTKPGAQTVDGRPAGFVNLAIRGLYPPGSTFKIVGAVAALQQGIAPGKTYHCTGKYQVGGWSRPFYCAVRSGHGPVDLANSLKYSCNVYYYHLVEDIGWEPFAKVAREFGFGELTEIDLPGEKAGQIAGTAEPAAGEATNLAIGQGSMLATPLQVARAFAGIATGRLPVPHVVQSIGGKPVSVPLGKTINISSAHRSLVIEGLSRVVDDSGGTARKARLDRAWQVCGKTGTAENASGGVDAWFAGFFPRSAPRYAFAIHVVDASGHGGEIAGPIARELIAEVYAEAPEDVVKADR